MGKECRPEQKGVRSPYSGNNRTGNRKKSRKNNRNNRALGGIQKTLDLEKKTC